MKVRVDPGLCQGHTLCWMAAPDAFVLDEIDGHATAIDAEVPADQVDRVRDAIQSCPERAISEL
ncbi:ferredoxin [Nocardia bovistercoris]|uniref:Ferredoxin n=1 Tax=Nocardia bovistercoris TaxID=2785916 RepID=A0A931I8E7_9NOCA|nr:ferredoxin [Nocardia bovistercoris]MBH0775278.1 ferredoxin [Nocardia bovistercoris]